jgi:hypothetical protein
MRSRILSIGVLGVTLLAAASLRAQQAKTAPGTTAVTFRVTNPAGAEIAEAQIRTTIRSATATLPLDEHGHLSLKLPAAIYNWPVSAPGYKTAIVSLDLTSTASQASPTKNVVVVLQPDATGSQESSQTKDTLLLTAGTNHVPVSVSLADFRAMPHVTITVHNAHVDADETYSGVTLAALLAKLDAPLGEHLRGKALASYIVASGSDGYSVVLSIAEVDPSFHGGEILVADTRDGQPLRKSGPFQLIVSEDNRPARWVHNLVSISLQDAR